VEYTSINSKHKRSCINQIRAIKIILRLLLLASAIYGVSLWTSFPLALAASHVSCADPSDTSAPPMPATPGIVVINEVLSFPQLEWTCTTPNNTSNQENAWIEIYNPQDQPYDLYAAHARIEINGGMQQDQVYPLPLGSLIAAHSFLVVFPATNLPPNGYTQLSSIRLTIPPDVIDEVSPPALAADTSYARVPDGSNNWQIMATPTIASSNNPPSDESPNESPTATAKTASGSNTQNHTTKQKSTNTKSSSSSKGGSSSNSKASTDTPNTGVQPTWSALQLPSAESNNAALDNTTQHNSSPADPFDPLKKILLTSFIIVFFPALLWCWRLYKKRSTYSP
jgi:hypothetical protein